MNICLGAEIDWRNFNGLRITDPTKLSHPFLEIALANEQADPKIGPWMSTLAMVDSGLSRTLIHPSLIRALNAENTGEIELSGNWGAQAAKTYRLQAQLAAVPQVAITMEVCALDHPLGFKEAMALIGMDFLHFGRLVLQGPSPESRFDFLSERLDAPRS